ncbi:hypothetical protein L596_019206 [Steinernema carpocapsae]|uniref:Uncharacterized protein n=1 Tax=Steinernema carpocapsae TaxID=34508 RepID=A0A4U5MPP2_STECR|nr:hypothetical protein L596_019206 [Steinernema carpocapsae]
MNHLNMSGPNRSHGKRLIGTKASTGLEHRGRRVMSRKHSFCKSKCQNEPFSSSDVKLKSSCLSKSETTDKKYIYLPFAKSKNMDVCNSLPDL